MHIFIEIYHEIGRVYNPHVRSSHNSHNYIKEIFRLLMTAYELFLLLEQTTASMNDEATSAIL